MGVGERERERERERGGVGEGEIDGAEGELEPESFILQGL